MLSLLLPYTNVIEDTTLFVIAVVPAGLLMGIRTVKLPVMSRVM